ncbi:MAG: radical SAM protein [Candidatus Omnitrophica bacterium]|nr:radical SAM protein [Candidatus Omnitrophota bacterium]MBD3268613.1 radical SAM protein [Candidatus Omnitrophota bacterium]
MASGRINEIFKSIQGEGLYQGAVQVFVRFSGCNLNCSFCDTDTGTFNFYDAGDTLRKIDRLAPYDSVSLTGGEPLLQDDFLREVTGGLKKRSKVVYLETNGTLPFKLAKVIDCIDVVAMDFKLPSSARLGSFWEEHREFLGIGRRKIVFVKAVVGENTERADIEKSIRIIRDIDKKIPFILQLQNPFEDILRKKAESFAYFCKAKGLDVRVLSQLHKQLGVK